VVGPAVVRVPQLGAPIARPDAAATGWPRRYARLVRTADLAALAVAVAAGSLLITPVTATASPAAAAALVSAIVVAALGTGRAWDPVVLGVGSTEFRRLVTAVGAAAVALALGGLAVGVDDAVRPWVFAVLPGYAALSVALRGVLRSWLHGRRRDQRFRLPVLAVGNPGDVADLIARTRRDHRFGWTVTGACTPSGTGPGGAPDVDGVPVVGDLDSVSAVVGAVGYAVVAVAPGPGWTSRRLHELAWRLEGTRTELVIDPGLAEFGRGRLGLVALDGTPVLQLCAPRRTGVRAAGR
jgi:FlaA1/EpsC-like NDP-sugar epimerase